MAKDYKSYSSNHKKTKSGGGSKFFVIAIVAIVIILLLAVGFHKISQRKLAKQAALVGETKLTKKEKNSNKKSADSTDDAIDTTTGDADAGDSAPKQPEIKFEFYNILPNEKVVDNSATPANDSTPVTQPTTNAAAAKATEKTNTAAINAEQPKTTAPVTSTLKPATVKPPAPVAPTAAPKAAVASGYLIQVVSVRNPKDANSISSKLTNDGFNVQKIKINANGTDWYRIQVGPYKTMDEALSAQMTLRKNNYHAILLKPK